MANETAEAKSNTSPPPTPSKYKQPPRDYASLTPEDKQALDYAIYMGSILLQNADAFLTALPLDPKKRAKALKKEIKDSPINKTGVSTSDWRKVFTGLAGYSNWDDGNISFYAERYIEQVRDNAATLPDLEEILPAMHKELDKYIGNFAELNAATNGKMYVNHAGQKVLIPLPTRNYATDTLNAIRALEGDQYQQGMAAWPSEEINSPTHGLSSTITTGREAPAKAAGGGGIK